MNSGESDSLRAALSGEGFIEASNPSEADVAIINTCSVRKTAEERIIGRLGFYRGLREKKGSRVKVLFLGCMAQSKGIEIREKYPDIVIGVWGTYNKAEIADYLKRSSWEIENLDLSNYRFMEASPQNKYPFKSFVPISHGCNNFCSYCIVPYVRGREVCRKSSDILDNIFSLMDRGVLEVTLLGQNVNSYKDGNVDFPGLLDMISVKTKIPRITFLTSHPKDMSKELIEAVKTHDNILKTIHLPLQSASDRILSGMNRHYTFGEYIDKIEIIRTIPGVVISTDIIAGFPGETDEEFIETLDAVGNIKFDEVFMYYYNSRPGTAALNLKPEVPLKIKKERLGILIKLQHEISRQRLSSFTGFKTTALIDGKSKKDGSELTGRTHNGLAIYLSGDPGLTGRIVPVQITGRSGTGLKASIITEYLRDSTLV